MKPRLENPGALVPRYADARIVVPARLHFGFLDLEGGLGRRFGSLGLALDGVQTRLHAESADEISAGGPSADRAVAFARRIAAALDLPGGARITVEEAIPEHAGLGSGTQLGLAVGAAFAGLYGLEPDAREIAALLHRGARSGIGIGAFEQGGVLLDGGRRLGDEDAPAPIISRLPFPAAWRIVLVLDPGAQGLHGEAETEAFRRLPPFPAARSAHLCRLVLMVALPALAEGDLEGFGRALTELQDTIGDHFAFAQGGRFSSPAVAEALAWLKRRGVAGAGQSSWGPTGFALFDDEAAARAALAAARAEGPGGDGLRFVLCRGRNEGSRIDMGRPIRATSGAARG